MPFQRLCRGSLSFARILAKDTAARPAMRDVAAELSNLRQAGFSAVVSSAQLSPVAAQTVHMSDTRHTTLGQATGQLQKGSLLRPLRLAIAAGCLLLVGGGVLLYSRGHGHGPIAAVGQPVGSVGSVHWHIVSDPAGAEVVTEPDGQVLGQTPLDYTTPSSQGAQAVVLRQHGFAERRLLLSRSADEQRSETLLATTAAPQPAGTPGATAKGKPSKPPEVSKPVSKPVGPPSRSQPAAKRPPSALRNEQVPLFR